MTRQQTVWPGWPSYTYLPREYAGVLVPSLQVAPCFYDMVIKNPSPNENRKFLLDCSVFDLVDGHKYLALTDPKLLGWYLCLTPEDRKIIQDDGGFHQFLQRHPALQLSLHHVYVKYNIPSVIPAQPTVTSNRPTHVPHCLNSFVFRFPTSGAMKCRSEMPHTHLDLERLTNVRETLTLLGCNSSGDGSQKHLYEKICHSKDLLHLQDGFQTAFSSPSQGSSHLYEHRPPRQRSSSSAAVCKDPAALANVSLDMDLERSGRGGKPELRSPIARPQGQSANFTCAEVSPVQSEWQKTIESGSSPEYYGLHSIQMDASQNNERSIIQPVELEQVRSPLVEENTKEACEDHMVCGDEYTADNDEASLSFADQSDNFHSIMENDQSILSCLTSEDVKAQNKELHSDGEAQAACSDTLNAVIKMNTADRCTSPMPCVTTCDSMVGTERALCTSAVTQTEDPETADKHVITEVHMADLDYLTEEFIKLKITQDEVREQKEKSSGCKVRKDCDCVQRAQQAELCLVALQYSMCRQHCSTLYYTSAEGGQLTPMPKNPPANVVRVLQKLESDYNQMRDKILGGVRLQQLKPLSVDSEKIITGTSYVPAQIIGDVLANVPSWRSEEPQKHNPSSGEENGCPDDQSRIACQQSHSQEKQIKKKNSKAGRALTLVPKYRDAIRNSHKPEEKQTTAACEAWYDAEEDLEPAGPAGPAETGQEQTVFAKDPNNKSAGEEVKSSVLCVSNLPSDVTESDVMLWFEKHQASEVNVCCLENDLSVAIVMLNGPQSAEAAVKELNGCSMRGHTLHVEHFNRAIGESQASATISGPEGAKPHATKTASNSPEGKLISQAPLGSSMKNRKVVCISPAAKGTCVPQHYATMGSFDTLMTELTQRHPDVARQRIVDALMELKATQQGVLSGLPLRTIREMTSELLTRPASAAQI
ncbi:RNA-binding protein 44 isoform X2 [Cottoperca gobio]|uniref:RNA-binding protein 44 isoform X2 n=1 Tax=Cottoperca gobio TaxID=56716 RepID=A0A6J2RXU7_COTGO|nr:RNA-binding protein 44 isoform X2 [Cottoperca gobio]